ncbi:NUDIX hydrolase [Trueperella bernardiae]|uniref:NUDIX hydrolase N-terminal domain-containing protein n=1 Tax=Trueperella bernardiae TaxID=59561 RepID=UPI0023F042CF|nr:NUDIX hydrolase [Trueperella bernardiae]WIM08098.1 NUDIX hydrolase [Trueperella bernardiae]
MNEQWLTWATEIQAIAQTGLAYATDVFDRERYTRLREISAEILASYTDVPVEKVAELFCNEDGYQTPKLDTRAVIVREGKILLVQEASGRWAMPGGWADIGLTLGQNVAKETKEEAGLDVVPRRVLAVQDRAKHNQPELPWSIWKIFVACDVMGGQFEANVETIDSGYFGLDELPPLHEGKTTRAQVEMCLAGVAAGAGADVVFD